MLLVLAPTQPAAGLFWSKLPLPPRETTPTTACVSSAMPGPPLSPEQIDSPTAKSLGGSGEDVMLPGNGPTSTTLMPLRVWRMLGKSLLFVTPQPTAVMASSFLGP